MVKNRLSNHFNRESSSNDKSFLKVIVVIFIIFLFYFTFFQDTPPSETNTNNVDNSLEDVEQKNQFPKLLNPK